MATHDTRKSKQAISTAMAHKFLRDLRLIKLLFAFILSIVFLDYLDDIELVSSYIKF
jgi:hypothetical protein